jgi:hypothetical protein
MMTGTELVRYDDMCRAIAAAYEVDEVKDIRDKAAALEHYSRQAHNVEAERQCAEIRLRAERKSCWAMDKAKGAAGNPGGQGASIVRSDNVTTQTLSELGITKNQSSQWQKLATVPEPQFEAALAGPDKPTTNGIINAAFPPTQPPAEKKLAELPLPERRETIKQLRARMAKAEAEMEALSINGNELSGRGWPSEALIKKLLGEPDIDSVYPGLGLERHDLARVEEAEKTPAFQKAKAAAAARAAAQAAKASAAMLARQFQPRTVPAVPAEASSRDPRRQGEILIEPWVGDHVALKVQGKRWATVFSIGSRKRVSWVVRDSGWGTCGGERCGTRDEAIDLAVAMIRDGRLFSPTEVERLTIERSAVPILSAFDAIANAIATARQVVAGAPFLGRGCIVRDPRHFPARPKTVRDPGPFCCLCPHKTGFFRNPVFPQDGQNGHVVRRLSEKLGFSSNVRQFGGKTCPWARIRGSRAIFIRRRYFTRHDELFPPPCIRPHAQVLTRAHCLLCFENENAARWAVGGASDGLDNNRAGCTWKVFYPKPDRNPSFSGCS